MTPLPDTVTPSPDIVIETVDVLTDEIVAAVEVLVPQLSSGPLPSRADLETIIRSDATTLFIARDRVSGGVITGMLTLVMFRIPTGLRAWIEDVVVDRRVHRRGVGRALSEAALARAKAAGARTIDLTSRPGRVPANNLYQGLGFELRGTNVYRYVPPRAGPPPP